MRLTPDLKMKQIISAPFQNPGQCLSYSILGISEDGSVWRYDPACKGWIKYSMEMKLAECGTEAHNR